MRRTAKAAHPERRDDMQLVQLDGLLRRVLTVVAELDAVAQQRAVDDARGHAALRGVRGRRGHGARGEGLG